MQPLPIEEVLPSLLDALSSFGAAVLKAPTGAGKTTRVAPALLDEVEGQVVVVEPRRVAARAAASRVAEEQGWRLGSEVGYRMRFEDRSSASTRVLFVTEGVLLGWLYRDPFLEGVGAVLFDEFHERSLAIDLGLAMTQRVRSTVREDLWLIAMSATLEVAALAARLGDCPTVESEGRLFPVEIEYLKRPDERPVATRVAAAVRRILTRERRGDVLAFLPGVAEIRRVRGELEGLNAEVHELYGDLPMERQSAALRSGANRRVVLATNVAETSVTVEGVTWVVDSGLERRLELDPATGFDRLELRAISRSSAAQRAGRAGRLAAGHCLRLWTASEESQRLASTPPEVRRADLSGALLGLVAWGERQPLDFPWVESPDPGRAIQALGILERLRLLERDGDGWVATAEGVAATRLGCAPRLARLLLTGRSLGVLERASLAAGLLQERDVFRRQDRGGQDPEWQAPPGRSDLDERIRALEELQRGRAPRSLVVARARRVVDVARRLAARAAEEAPEPAEAAADEDEALSRALLAAFPDRVAKRRPSGDTSRALMVGGQGVRLARSSVVRAPLFLALDVGRASASVGAAGSPREPLVFLATSLEESWLPAADVVEERVVGWDASAERPTAQRQRRFLDLVLDRVDAVPTPEETEAALVAAARSEPETYLDFSEGRVQQLLARVNKLASWRPELGLPDLREELLVSLPLFVRGKRSAADLRALDLHALLLGLLDWNLRQTLDELAPEAIDLENGRRARITYTARVDEDPILALQIQFLFGVRQTPTVDGGRRPVLLHLLAPSQRAQQVTSDLAGFWAGSYALVKKDLAGRYPKHSWPDDPANAEPPRRRRR
ncbi:MAG: ATP-dependent helicase HrpB [Acidobacteriota bacterium]